MTEELLTEMNYDTMSALLDNYIERSSQQSGEMPASSFFTLLFANRVQRIRNTVEVEGRIINGQLILSQSDIAPSDVYVENNQIVIGEQRIVVRLKA